MASVVTVSAHAAAQRQSLLYVLYVLYYFGHVPNMLSHVVIRH